MKDTRQIYIDNMMTNNNSTIIINRKTNNNNEGIHHSPAYCDACA